MKVLLAEDERDLSRAVCAVLKMQGYDAAPAYDGEEAVQKAAGNAYDCMVFDIMMPKKDGITALKEIRSTGDVTPVIFLTAKAELDDRVNGLDAGADDYLTKPFAMKELLARIRSATRRAEGYAATKISVGNVTLDTSEQELSCRNSVRLGGKEGALMEVFMRNEGRAFSTEELLRKVWSDEPEQTGDIVWVYVSYLRNKLKSVGAGLEIAGERDGAFVLRQRND